MTGGVLCVWARLPDDCNEWYEDEYIPAMTARNSIHTLHCELTASGFEGDPIGQLDSPWPLLAVYESPDIQVTTRGVYDKANHPSDELLSGPLAQARFDVRTYRELKRWQAEDWDGDVSHVASVTAMEWQVPSETHDEIIGWYTSYVAPLIVASPDTLRFRFFEVDNATVLQGESYETKEKNSLHTYFTLVELAIEEWPWDAVFELSDNKEWKQYFEEQRMVKWQIGTYLVKKLYNEKYPKGLSSTRSDASTDAGSTA